MVTRRTSYFKLRELYEYMVYADPVGQRYYQLQPKTERVVRDFDRYWHWVEYETVDSLIDELQKQITDNLDTLTVHINDTVIHITATEHTSLTALLNALLPLPTDITKQYGLTPSTGWTEISIPAGTISTDNITIEGDGSVGDKVRFKNLADNKYYGIYNGTLYELDITGLNNGSTVETTVTDSWNFQLWVSGKIWKIVTGTNIKAWLKTYFDSIYATIASLAGYLKLDQTTPQSVINGSPIMEGIQLNITPSTSGYSEGLIRWNLEDGTVDVGLPGGVVGQMFQELFFDGKNQTGSDILDGTPIMFAAPIGVSGKVEIQPAIADGSFPSEFIMGIASENITNGSFGKVTWFGKVRGIDTTGTPYGEVWAIGDRIYVGMTAGSLTNVEPNVPAQRILIAVVLARHVNNGVLLLRPTWNGKLTGLDDVNGTPLTVSGQIMVWDEVNQYFDFTDNINNYVNYENTTITTSATPTPTGGKQVNRLFITALTNDATFAAPTGTPLNSNSLLIQITAAGTQTLAWNAIYSGSMPTSISAETLQLEFLYNEQLVKWVYQEGGGGTTDFSDENNILANRIFNR